MELTHASFFSGIGAFDLGLELAGFRCVSHAEVKPFSSAVLETHWPGVPNLGDINAICPDGEGDHVCEIPRATVWTGGFPCSDFSIMGKRKGLLGGRRSSLGLVFLDLVRRHRPPFLILENVPGLLTSHEGRDLGLLLGTLVDIGYGWSYRLLDARNFGLPQARRRVFVVAAADPADAGAVLDDATDRGVAPQALARQIGAVVARSPGGPVGDAGVVIGPTYAVESRAIQRTDGSAYPLTPNNFQYVLEERDVSGEPLSFTFGERSDRPRRGATGPVRPQGNGSRLWVADREPIVLERHGHFTPQVKRDGTAYTLLPTGDGGNIGQQYVIGGGDGGDGDGEPTVFQLTTRRGPVLARGDGAAYTLIPDEHQHVIERDREPVVLKRKGHDFGSDLRGDGAAFTLQPGVGRDDQYVILDGGDGDLDERDGDDGWGWDDLPAVGGDGRDVGLGGDGRGGGSGADWGPADAPPAADRQAADGDVPAGPGETDHADGVRASAGLPGRLDDPDSGESGEMGPQHLDGARWHVLGRACPVPIVEWMGQAIRTVVERKVAAGEWGTDR